MVETPPMTKQHVLKAFETFFFLFFPFVFFCKDFLPFAAAILMEHFLAAHMDFLKMLDSSVFFSGLVAFFIWIFFFFFVKLSEENSVNPEVILCQNNSYVKHTASFFVFVFLGVYCTF